MWFHLSDDNGLTELTPKVPSCAIPMYENVSTKRICFSDSIDGCLSALDPPTDSMLYAYTPIEEINAIKPDVNDVRDAKYTWEVWSLNKVQVKNIGKVMVIKLKESKNKNSGRGRVCIRTYDWKFI